MFLQTIGEAICRTRIYEVPLAEFTRISLLPKFFFLCISFKHLTNLHKLPRLCFSLCCLLEHEWGLGFKLHKIRKKFCRGLVRGSELGRLGRASLSLHYSPRHVHWGKFTISARHNQAPAQQNKITHSLL